MPLNADQPTRSPATDGLSASSQSAGPVLQPERKRTLGERILQAGFALLAAHVLLKLIGLLIRNIIPNYYGAEVSDVYVFVAGTVLGTAFSFGEQCLSPALLPVFTRAKEKDGESRAWRYLSLVFNVQLVLVVLLTVALALFAEPIVGLLTQWDAPNITLTTAEGRIRGELVAIDDSAFHLSVDGQARVVPRAEITQPALSEEYVKKLQASLAQRQPRRELGARMLPYVAPALIGMSMASLTYGVLIAHKSFFFAAFGDALLRICVALGALLGAWIGKADWRFIAAGAVIGGTAKLVVHLLALGIKRLRNYQFTLNLRDPYFQGFVLLVLPLLLGIFFSSVRDLIIKNALTTQALLPTYFDQGRAVVDSLAFLVPFTLSIALLPYFCDLAARDDNRQLAEILTGTVRLLLWFFLPVTIILAVAALPICFVLYSGKLITAEHIRYPAVVMQLFAIQLPFAAMEMMVMQAFFSNRRMLAPTVTGMIFSAIAAGAAYWLVIARGMDDPYSTLMVVAACVVVTKAVKSCVLVGLLKTTVPVLPLAQTLGFFGQLALAGTGAAAAAWGTSWLLRGPFSGALAALKNQRVQNLAEAVAVAAAGALVYLALSFVLRMDEPRSFWRWTREKLKRRGQSTPAAGPIE